MAAQYPITPVRLSPDDVAAIDEIAARLASVSDLRPTRAGAIRYGIRLAREQLGILPAKSPPKKTSRKSARFA